VYQARFQFRYGASEEIEEVAICLIPTSVGRTIGMSSIKVISLLLFDFSAIIIILFIILLLCYSFEGSMTIMNFALNRARDLRTNPYACKSANALSWFNALLCYHLCHWNAS
jgi:hypothetical protein